MNISQTLLVAALGGVLAGVTGFGAKAVATPATAGTRLKGERPVDLAIRKDDKSVSLVSVFRVESQNQERLVRLLEDGTEKLLSKQPGYIGTSVLKSVDGRHVVLYSQWRSATDIEAYRAKPDVREAFKRLMPIATFDTTISKVAYVHHR